MNGWVDFSHEITPSTPKSTPIIHPNSGMKFKKFSNRVLFLFVILVTSLDMNDVEKLMKHRDDLVRKIEYHQKSLKIRKKIGTKNEISFSLNNIGNIYKNTNKYKKALQYYHEALALDEKRSDKPMT